MHRTRIPPHPDPLPPLTRGERAGSGGILHAQDFVNSGSAIGIIELVSVYLDWRVMTGRGKTSGAWGVAFGIFVLFGLYGALVGNRRDEPFVFTRELAGALSLIGFQIVFHGLYPWARIYWLRRDS